MLLSVGRVVIRCFMLKCEVIGLVMKWLVVVMMVIRLLVFRCFFIRVIVCGRMVGLIILFMNCRCILLSCVCGKCDRLFSVNFR